MIKFEKIIAEDSARYMSYLVKCPEIPSDCCNAIVFGYGAVWLDAERGYKDGLCWQKAIYNGSEFWLPPIGDWRGDDWKKIFSENIPAGALFRYVPGMLMNIWSEAMPGAFDITFNENEWDYLYDIPEFWNSNADLRTKYRRFCRLYDYETEIITSSNTDAVLELDRRAGMAIREKKTGLLSELEEDDRAMLNVLENWDKLGTLSGLLLRVSGEYVSYSIWDTLDYRAFELYNKNIYKYRDVHTAMLVERTEKLKEEGFRLLNDMCDAGDIGIRLNKLRHKPSGMLKKYNMLWHGLK